MSEQYTVTFLPSRRQVRVACDTILLQAILDDELELSHTCGGHCTCGSCIVEIIAERTNLSRPRFDEAGHLTNGRARLACQSKVRGDVTVHIPAYAGPYGPAGGPCSGWPVHRARNGHGDRPV